MKLDSTNFILDRDTIKFYYDQFRYKIKISIYGIQFFRSCDSESKLDQKISYYMGNIRYHDSDINDIINHIPTIKIIREFVRWNEHRDKSKSKLVITQNTVILYSNDIDVFESLTNSMSSCGLDLNKKVKYYQVEQILNYQKDVIYLKDPKYKFRIYLKTEKHSDSEKHKIKEFFDHYNVKLCPSLKRWINFEQKSTSIHRNYLSISSWVWSYYFFEFNEESLITITSLKFDKLIGKICTVQKR